jgi:hypothetical protein
MISVELIIVLILAYLIGSISNAVWIGKVFYKKQMFVKMPELPTPYSFLEKRLV